MFGKFTYRLNPKYTQCHSVYTLMPSHRCCAWTGFRAAEFSSLPLTKPLQRWGLKKSLTGHRHAGEVFELFGLWYELVRILMYVTRKANERPSVDIKLITDSIISPTWRAQCFVHTPIKTTEPVTTSCRKEVIVAEGCYSMNLYPMQENTLCIFCFVFFSLSISFLGHFKCLLPQGDLVLVSGSSGWMYR